MWKITPRVSRMQFFKSERVSQLVLKIKMKYVHLLPFCNGLFVCFASFSRLFFDFCLVVFCLFSYCRFLLVPHPALIVYCLSFGLVWCPIPLRNFESACLFIRFCLFSLFFSSVPYFYLKLPFFLWWLSAILLDFWCVFLVQMLSFGIKFASQVVVVSQFILLFQQFVVIFGPNIA